MLNNIVFSFGKNLNYGDSSSNWVSFLINLSGVLIGAFLAYLISLQIDKKQRKDEKEIELSKTKALNNERLKHLTTLIDNAIEIADKQSNQYIELSNQIKGKPYEQHLISITLTNDFERIKRLDTQKIFDAYTYAIRSNNERIKNYSKLFHQIDFIGFKLEQMYDMHAKHNNFTFNDQCYIRDIIDDIVNILTTLAVELTESLPNEYQNNSVYLFVTDLLHKSSINSNSGLSYFENEFIIPLRDNCRTIGFNKTLANLILEKTKRVLSRFKNIEFNAIEHSENCAKFKGEIEPTIKRLKELNDEIKINVP